MPAFRRIPGSPHHVLIAGGGFAAAEAMLALRALAGDRVAIDVVSPEDRLYYRPAATLEPFCGTEPLTLDLRELASDVGATFRRDRLAAVASDAQRVRLDSFAHLRYDSLLLAVGTARRVRVAGAVTFADQRDVGRVRAVLDELARGEIRRIAFAIPGGVTWPLPIYELALLTAAFADEHGLPAEVSIVTPERRPLEVFGGAISARVRDALADRMVRFVGDVIPQAARRDGRLEVHFGDAIHADRVIAVPELIGRRVSGVPAGWGGFVPVDRDARVLGLRDVFAAGDMTTHPVKQGGLATQHADAAARAIAAGLGIEVAPQPDDNVLEVRLAGADPPLVLSAALDATGRSVGAAVHRGARVMPGEKVLGRYLSPYLRERARAATAA